LNYFNPDDPQDEAEMDAYEEFYFVSPDEVKNLIRVERELLYEALLGQLPDIDKESFKRLPFGTLLEQELREALALSTEELEERLRKIKAGE
jgi:hypothetical protein